MRLDGPQYEWIGPQIMNVTDRQRQNKAIRQCISMLYKCLYGI